MGRYLALGVACEIQFNKRSDVSIERFNAIRSNLKNSIERYICVEHYNVIDGEDFVYYGIKEEVVNKNIYELVREIEEIVSMEDFMYKIGIRDKETCDSDEEFEEINKFNKKDCPLQLKYFDESDSYESEQEKERKYQTYMLITPNGEVKTDRPYPPFNIWMIYDKDNLVENAKGETRYLLLWFDWNKSGAENEMTVVELLNKLLIRYFKNPLAKDLQFYISG